MDPAASNIASVISAAGIFWWFAVALVAIVTVAALALLGVLLVVVVRAWRGRR